MGIFNDIEKQGFQAAYMAEKSLEKLGSKLNQMDIDLIKEYVQHLKENREVIGELCGGDSNPASESGLLPFTYETLPLKIRDKMSKAHEHAELLDPEELCYKESDVMDIINTIYGNNNE